MNLPSKFLAIDEDGYPVFSGLRVTDEDVGTEILSHIQMAPNGAFQTQLNGEFIFVEAFDEPLIAQQVFHESKKWKIILPYSVEFEFSPHSLTLDEWDRFHGMTHGGIPFVFSRRAQAEFFNLVDDYDDDSITLNNEKIKIPDWLSSTAPVEQAEFWTQIYQTETPGWELEAPAPILVQLLPQLKLPRSRVLVLGCGSGNDAAYLAQAGHIVTGVDISHEALGRAHKKYSSIKGLTFLQKDIFDLGPDYTGQFDLIFEHTCYCAISPRRRNDLIQLWRRLLSPGGQILGVFFTMERRGHPPFGGSEWELRERFKKYFRLMYWNRSRISPGNRMGKELNVLLQKI